MQIRVHPYGTQMAGENTLDRAALAPILFAIPTFAAMVALFPVIRLFVHGQCCGLGGTTAMIMVLFAIPASFLGGPVLGVLLDNRLTSADIRQKGARICMLIIGAAIIPFALLPLTLPTLIYLLAGVALCCGIAGLRAVTMAWIEEVPESHPIRARLHAWRVAGTVAGLLMTATLAALLPTSGETLAVQLAGMIIPAGTLWLGLLALRHAPFPAMSQPLPPALGRQTRLTVNMPRLINGLANGLLITTGPLIVLRINGVGTSASLWALSAGLVLGAALGLGMAMRLTDRYGARKVWQGAIITAAMVILAAIPLCALLAGTLPGAQVLVVMLFFMGAAIAADVTLLPLVEQAGLPAAPMRMANTKQPAQDRNRATRNAWRGVPFHLVFGLGICLLGWLTLQNGALPDIVLQHGALTAIFALPVALLKFFAVTLLRDGK